MQSHGFKTTKILLNETDMFTYVSQNISFKRRINKNKQSMNKFWTPRYLTKREMPLTLEKKIIALCILPSLT